MNVAIYGTLKATLLFWKTLSSSIEQRRYIIHTHNYWYAVEEDTNETQYTIVWHVDDLKLAHQDPTLSAKYDKVDEMAVRRGNKHYYLGTTLGFSEDNRLLR